MKLLRTKRRVVSLIALILMGQSILHAQEISHQDSLKISTQQIESPQESFVTHTTPLLPEELSVDDTFNEATSDPAYINTREWNLNFKEPTLPLGIQGGHSYNNYIGLGSTRSAFISKNFQYGKLSFSPYATLDRHSYDYMNAVVFSVGGSLSYSLNNQLSLTAFGRYATTPGVIFSPAVMSMISTSRFGGYATYDFDYFSLSGGVRREFNPYTNKWDTYPIIMPTFKIGGAEISIDVGPAVKNAIQNHQGPPPPPQRK